MKTKFTWFLMTWTLGGLWVLVTMAAGLAALTSNTTVELGILGYMGIILWVFGFVVEVVADRQKTEFRKDPANQGRFITSGIWSWSQHPNYFGEITLWFGLALLAFPVLSGWQLATLVSPIFVFLLLTRISGIPLLDRAAKKEVGFRYRIFSVCASDLKANAGSTEKIVARFAGLQTVKFWY